MLPTGVVPEWSPKREQNRGSQEGNLGAGIPGQQGNAGQRAKGNMHANETKHFRVSGPQTVG